MRGLHAAISSLLIYTVLHIVAYVLFNKAKQRKIVFNVVLLHNNNTTGHRSLFFFYMHLLEVFYSIFEVIKSL